MEQPDPASDGNASARPGGASLLQFLSGMGAQTLVHLGAMQNPLTGKTERDLPNARYSIDLLQVLQEKTRGNLTPEEEEYFKHMLTQLRLSYVASVEAAAASSESQERGGADTPAGGAVKAQGTDAAEEAGEEEE